jgi:alpha-L-fucosidase
MFMKSSLKFLFISLAFNTIIANGQNTETHESGSGFYEPTWESLSKHGTASGWYEDALLGVSFHWGIYSVPAYHGEKYPKFMHTKGRSAYEHHTRNYGDPCEFGYHDFIPMFKAEKWDPERWAKLFKYAGADYAGSIGEHHDGYPMWDTRYRIPN